MTEPNTTFYRPRGEGIRDTSKVCSHIFAGGHRCASPALRGQTLCYNHQPSRLNLPSRADRRRARRTFPIPRPTNQLEVQQALTVVLQAIALDRIAPRRAGRLLVALQQLGNELPAATSPGNPYVK